MGSTTTFPGEFCCKPVFTQITDVPGINTAVNPQVNTAHPRAFSVKPHPRTPRFPSYPLGTYLEKMLGYVGITVILEVTYTQ